MCVNFNKNWDATVECDVKKSRVHSCNWSSLSVCMEITIFCLFEYCSRAILGQLYRRCINDLSSLFAPIIIFKKYNHCVVVLFFIVVVVFFLAWNVLCARLLSKLGRSPGMVHTNRPRKHFIFVCLTSYISRWQFGHFYLVPSLSLSLSLHFSSRVSNSQACTDVYYCCY